MFERRDVNQVFLYPYGGAVVTETPPCFVWPCEGEALFTVTVKDAGGTALFTHNTRKNHFVPEIPLESGTYIWSVSCGGEATPDTRFEISKDAVTFIRPTAEEVLSGIPQERPRHLFTRAELPSRPEAFEALKRNVELALSRPLPEPPRYHYDENALPYREYFALHREYTDRDLVACALMYAINGDEAAGSHAKRLFMHLCSMNPDGPCSLDGRWGDEVGLSNARVFPAVFDLLYELLDEKQRQYCARAVVAYAYQCESRINRIDFSRNPGHSHVGRLPAYLGEAALSLKGTGAADDETLTRWLNTALEIFGGMFPFYGSPDGGWAEGTFYASSYTKWYLPFFSAVKRFSGKDFLDRPFYRNYINYLRHFCPPGWETHPFGDGYWCKSGDREWPGFMAQNPWRVYAEKYGGAAEQAWSREADRQQIFNLHLLDVFLPDAAPSRIRPAFSRAQAFYDTGLVSLKEGEISLLARASRFEAGSHRHADQGSFAIMAGGACLIGPSGYFGRRFGTKHHFEYTRQSMAHNTLLIDGVGQEYGRAGMNGRVLCARDEGGRLTAAIAPANAYGGRMKKWIRSFELLNGVLTVTDEVELDKPGRLSYLLHSLSRPETDGKNVLIERGAYRMTISGSLESPTITDAFPIDINAGEPDGYHVSMPPQYHIRWETETGTCFSLKFVYRMEKR